MSSIHNIMLERTLPDQSEEVALKELEAFLESRLEAAKRGEWSDQTVDEIVNEVIVREDQAG